MSDVDAIDRTTPLGLYMMGVAYLEAARAVSVSDNRKAFQDPFDFLCAHGLELIFKAEMARALSMKEVRTKFGHNLSDLKNELGVDFTNEFPMTIELQNVINYLEIGHSGPDWTNRYIKTGVKNKLLPEQILAQLACFTTSNRKWLAAHFVKAVL